MPTENNLIPEYILNSSGQRISPIVHASTVMYENDQGEVENLLGRIDNGSNWDNLIIGSVHLFAGPNNPKGFLNCDGSEYNRSQYAELFAAIGTTYGAGNGSTTFNVPWIADNGTFRWIIKAKAIMIKPENGIDISNLTETGVFLPKYKIATWNQEGNTDNITYNLQKGYYYRIGNYVHISYVIDCINLASATGVTGGWACINISDCPYTPFKENGVNETWTCVLSNGEVDTSVKGFGTNVIRIGNGPGFGGNLIVGYGSGYNRANYTDFKNAIYCAGSLGFVIDPS